MKHKKFNQVYPYTYYIKHIQTNIKYYGFRFGNLRKNRTPEEDFCKFYFTSIGSSEYKWLKDELKNNKSNFIIRLHYTFDSREEALEYEQKFLSKVVYKPTWANKSLGKYTFIDKFRPYKNICCLYCKKHVDMGNFTQSHGANCKIYLGNSYIKKTMPEKTKQAIMIGIKNRIHNKESSLKMSISQKNRKKSFVNSVKMNMIQEIIQEVMINFVI